jgi:hypothetical protein
LGACAEKETADRLGTAFISCAAAEEVHPFDGVFSLVLHCVYDLFVLGEDEGVVFRFVFEVGEDFECFVFVFVRDEPSIRYSF